MAIGSKNGVIRSTPLDLCVAVIAYDKNSKIIRIAHIILTCKSPTKDKTEENKYAQNAIENLLDKLKNLDSKKANIEICLLGGENVLKKKDDTIADNLIFSIFEIIKQEKLIIKKTLLVRHEKRTAKLCLNSGIVSFTLGDNSEEELFNFFTGNTGGLSYE